MHAALRAQSPVALCDMDDLTEGEPFLASTPCGRKIAVYLVDGQVFASDDLCTHGDASLADGEIDGYNIVCPFHLGSFDIRTGEVVDLPCAINLKTYPVAIHDGVVSISL